MSGLASRIARAAHTEKPVLSSTTVLPFDIVCDFLNDHPVVRNMGVSSREVHSALLEINRRVEEAPTPPVETPIVRPFDCLQCKAGRYVVVHHDGENVCDNCGIVAGRQLMVCQYERPSDNVHQPKTSSIRGVPGWLVLKMATPYESMYSGYWDRLQHYNIFTKLSHEQLQCADRRLRTWTDTGLTRDARLAASLLYPLIKDHFPATISIREHIRRHESIPVLNDPTPIPMFACGTCGVTEHTAKGARFHCFVNNPRKRRR